jgi:type IV secretory pathway VirB9-like protein
MRLGPWTLIVCLLAGCTPAEPPTPPVVPMAEDLSAWIVPEVVHTRAPVAVRHVPHERPPSAAEKVYPYTAGETYRVPVAPGFPLDIVFSRGEQVHNLTDGDRAPQGEGHTRRWEARQGVSGTGESQRHHVFVTVTEPGLKNGLTVTTTARSYYITLESVPRTPIRVLRWQEDPEAAAAVTGAQQAPGLLPDPEIPTYYHTGYMVTSDHQSLPPWTPRQVLDSGTKMFLIYPEVTLFETVPLVRAIGPNGPMLINSRQYLNVVILDQLAPRLELRVRIGEDAEVVTITRGRLKTITCPDDAACPQWPQAARHRTRSTP